MIELNTPKVYEQRIVPIKELVEAEWNVNVLKWKKFDYLVESIQKDWFIEPIQVIELPEEEQKKYWWKYRILWGHHRVKAAATLWYEAVPAIVIPKEEYSEDRQKLITVRLNLIKWKVDPAKFTALYQEMLKKYPKEILNEMLAIEDEKELKKMLIEIEKVLPEEMKSKLKKAKKEIKTIDQLAEVLSRIMKENEKRKDLWFLVFNFNWNVHVMVNMDKELKKKIDKLTSYCENTGQNINNVLKDILNWWETINNIPKEKIPEMK